LHAVLAVASSASVPHLSDAGQSALQPVARHALGSLSFRQTGESFKSICPEAQRRTTWSSNSR
jgi:hypothetical protein